MYLDQEAGEPDDQLAASGAGMVLTGSCGDDESRLHRSLAALRMKLYFGDDLHQKRHQSDRLTIMVFDVLCIFTWN